MSYTSQKVAWKACSSNPIENKYGDIEYNKDILCSKTTICGLCKVGSNLSLSILARKQPMSKVFKTGDGRELLAKTVYYVDPYEEPKALEIKKMDRLDGELIEDIYIMVDLANKPRMLRFITV